MSNWEKNVRKVVPYVPGEQPHEADMIKLNTNENPYPPSPKAAEAIRRVAEEDTLRLYPDPTAAELVQAIADVYHVSPKQVFVGVGSDDVLAMAFMTYFNSDKPILFPDITYSFYDVWAEEFRIPYEQIPLDENFCIVDSYHSYSSAARSAGYSIEYQIKHLKKCRAGFYWKYDEELT